MADNLFLLKARKTKAQRAKQAKKFRSGGFKWATPPVLVRHSRNFLSTTLDGKYLTHMEFKDIPMLGVFKILDSHPAVRVLVQKVMGDSNVDSVDGVVVLMRTSDTHAHIIHYYGYGCSNPSPLHMLRIKFKQGYLVTPQAAHIEYADLLF